jgi:lipid A 3-O-deacylase
VPRWPKFNGWENQLKNEFGMTLHASRRWRLPAEPIPALGLEYDVIPHVEVEAGNVSTALSAGGMLRLGSRLPKNFGLQRISDSSSRGISVYGYAGAEASAVLHNIFLDGNTFRSSHHVAKEPLVGRLSAGLAIAYSRFHFDFSFVFESKEFKKQKKCDGYGRLTLAFDY